MCRMGTDYVVPSVYSMVHRNGFLEEEDILVHEDMEVGEVEGLGPSPLQSILDLKEEEDLSSQPDRRSEDEKDGRSSTPSRPPSLAPSWDPLTSLGHFSQTVRLNSLDKGSACSGPSNPAPGLRGPS